jgi:hypothetical protein
MTHSTPPTSLYRPKKLPRVIRRQYTVIRLACVVIVLGLIAFAVAWRNILHERIALDIARQRSAIDMLNQEIAQLQGTVEAASAYPRIAAWAENQYGWKPIQGRVHDIEIPIINMTPRLLSEVRVAGEIHE